MDERGSILIEALVAVLIMGVVIAVALGGLSTTMRGVGVVEEKVTAEALARSQLDSVQEQSYKPPPATYATVTPPAPDYTITAVAEALPPRDINQIQKIRVTISRGGEVLLQVEDVKVNR